ncbi:16249_t:CDS:2, partial [Racocetra persica]
SKTSSFDEEELINILNNEELKYLFQIDTTLLYEKDNNGINKQAFEISKNDNIRKKISEIIQKNTRQKGFVVVGCDSTDILPDAKIKLYLTANFETRVDPQKISDNIDTTYLEILEVVDLILKNVFN